MEHNPFEIPLSDGPSGSRRGFGWKIILVFGWIIFLVLLCLFVVWNKLSEGESQLTTKSGDSVSVDPSSLSDLSVADPLSSSASTKTLEVNGQLKVNNSLILDPSDPPKDPQRGQVYYDKTSNVPMYYDGTKFVAVAAKQDVAQATVSVTDVKPAASVSVDIPDDIAQTNSSNTFAKSNTFAQNLAVNGVTTLQSTSIASLILGQPLSVASGGTGTTSFAANGVIVGGGASALSSVTAASTGLCLMSTNGSPSFQACPSGGGSTPNAVTSTANSNGRIAKFGGGNSLVDSLISDDGSSVSINGNLNLSSYGLQLGNNGFAATLNTTSLSANRSIQLPNASGVVCLESSSSCGFVTGTPANFIQNQNSGAQASTNYWVAGVGRADGGSLGPSFDTAVSGGVLAIGGTNAGVIDIANNLGGHTVNIATGTGAQTVIIGSTSYSSALNLLGGAQHINITSGASIYNRYNEFYVLGNTSGTNHLTVNATSGEIVATTNSVVRVDGSFNVTNSTAKFDKGITVTNTAGLPSYVTPLGASLQTAINIPNYTMAAYGTILALGMDRLAPDSARAILVADAREYAHQPTIGVLNRAESDILGLSWEGQNGIGYIKTLGASVGIVLNNNAVARFHNASIELNQSTQIAGGLQVNGASGVKTDSTTAFLVQNASDQDLLKADTNTMTLTARSLNVTYNLTVYGDIIAGRHIMGGGATPTTITGPAACTSPTVNVSGTDTSGVITVVAGSGCGTTGAIMAVVFANAFTDTPKVTLTPATSGAAALQTYVDYNSMTYGAFDIATNTPLTNSTTYRWFYHVIQ